MVDGKIRRSPVGTAKALHLLAPDFLPIWDEKIAIKYGCRYSNNPEGKYFKFCGLLKDMAERVNGYIVPPKGRTILKVNCQYRTCQGCAKPSYRAPATIWSHTRIK